MTAPLTSDGGEPTLLDEAITAHRRGDLERANRLYGQVLEGQPDNAGALRLRGVLAREQGDLGRSIQLLKAAAEAAPQSPEPLSELGLSYMAAGHLHSAEAALGGAAALDPTSTKALANLGAVLQYRGHVAAAIDCYRRVLELEPDDLEVRCNLANTLLEAGQGEAAVAECDAGLARVPDHPMLLATQGAVLGGLEQFEAAVRLLERALARNPGDDMALINLAYARCRLDRSDAAVGALRQAMHINPDNARAAADLINLQTAAGHAGEALELGEQFLRRHPGERLVLAAYAFALADAHHADEARALLDYERLIRIAAIEPPAGYADIDTFNRELAALVQSEASLLTEPGSKATRGGQQTGELNSHEDVALAALAAVFASAAADYAAEMRAGGLGNHPAMAYAADHWTLRMWGTVLESGGHQTSHLHPLGWLSGVYYVNLPAGMTTADEPHAGWLVFGAPPERFVVRAEPELRAIEPQEGRLIVFPSYFCHGTQPFHAGASRISIAFDVVPTAV